MKNTLIVGMLALVLVAPGVCGELPGKAGGYLEKLREFELERVAAAEAEITQKRQQVAVALKRELTEATKRGDLDAANALKAEIDRLGEAVDLAALKASVPGKRAEGSKEDAKVAFKERFVGKTWKAFSYGYKFGRRGNVTRITLEGADKGREDEGREWKIISSDTVAVTGMGPTRYFTFTSATAGTTKAEGEAGTSPITLVE